ncbi:MAG: GNAT family N-acetyltransferase [Pseudomonadota bacterium]
MKTVPILETERLILRLPERADLEAWTKFHDDEEVMRFLGGVQGPELTWRSVCAMTGAWTIEGFSMFSVIEKATGNWIGRLGPWRPKGWPGTEIGWGLARSAWGQGYALEGSRAAMDYAVDTLGWTEIIHTILPENTASIRLAERLGSRLLRTAPGPPPFENMVWEVYGQSADEWRANRQAQSTK